MPTNSPQTVWNNLHQGTMTGPQYVAAFEKAYYALPPHNRPDEAAAVSLLFYRANEQVQNKIRAANGNDNDIPTFWSLSDMMDAIRSTPNPAHAKPVHPAKPAPAPVPQAARPQAVYYYPVEYPLFHGTTGPVGTINPGWWPQ